LHSEQRAAAGLLNVVAVGGDGKNIDSGFGSQFSILR
jgi:pyruvate/2-oxoacid:ferredoxin oxidoreductase beta subunit